MEFKNAKKELKAFGMVFAIYLLVVGSTFAALAGEQSNYSQKTPKIAFEKVVVTDGDTLWELSKEHYDEDYCSFREYVYKVEKLNGIDGNNIRIGQELAFPYIVK